MQLSFTALLSKFWCESNDICRTSCLVQSGMIRFQLLKVCVILIISLFLSKSNIIWCCYKAIFAKLIVFFFTGRFELSSGSKWIRSNVSYYGAMRASQSHQTLYFDGCGHTDSHIHVPPPLLPTSLTTHLCWLQSTQTHLLSRRAARKEVNIWKVELPGLTVKIRLLL